MRALSKLHAAPGIWAVETAKPEAGHGEVIVRVCKTGICGTDIHIYKWDAWAQATIPVPMVTGHEFAGEIADIGPGVTNLKLGQRVSAEGHVIGMRSRASRGGRYHLDPETQGIGVTLPGCFAEYVKVPAFNIIALPDDISDEIGAILDPLGNAVHTALSFDIAGEDVLITGAGPIGIMAAAVARHAGARHVVITDINTQRLALAAQVADVVTVNVAEERLEDVMARLRMNEGFDVGLEMSGSPEAFSQMIDLMVMGGRIALLGIPSRPFAIDWNRVVFRMLTIKGIYGREMFETWHKMIAMLQRGLDVSKVVTHRFDAVDFQQGFDAMAAGNSGKIVLDWTGKLPVPLNQPVAQATAERAGA